MAALADTYDRFLQNVLDGRNVGRSWLMLVAVLVPSAAAYGAVLGGWTSARLAVYVAVKLPLVLLLTSALTMLLSWVGARALGLQLSLGQVAVLTFLALAVAAVLLASLSPVAWVFTLAAPPPSTQARTAHNLLYLMHVCFVGGCGLAGTRVLWRGMRRLPAALGAVRAAYLLWVIAYALVGGQVAWALRPFVGSVYLPVVFVREDALDGNVYEFIVTDIAPHLAEQLD